MAWYYGTYACGCEGRVDIIGPGKDRGWKKEKAFSRICPDCYKKQLEEERKQENQEAAEKSVEMDLPELTGTEKQVAWATTIRFKIVGNLDKTIEKMRAAMAERGVDTIPGEDIGVNDLLTARQYFIDSHTDSRFWIDNRDKKFSLKGLCEDCKK